jgi:predicted ribosomally synthesized peptide with nif11-like leader
MSLENLKKYGQMCAEDEKVRARAKEIGLQDIDGQIAYGKSLGVEFSKEDFAAMAKEAGIENKDELSEEDLKKVAGGVFALTALSLLVVGGLVAGIAGGTAAATQPGW